VNQYEKSPYLELMKKVLIDYDKIGSMEYHPLKYVNRNWKTFFLYPIDKLLQKRNFSICKLKYIDKEKRLNGSDWPVHAKTMIGYKRLTNIEHCIRIIKEESIDGDLIETGVWRGGATIFMKAVLNNLNLKNKNVWLADSFKGVPPPKKDFPEDSISELHKHNILNVSKNEVKRNFELYDLLDESIKFIEGWFHDTLANTPIEKLSLLRIDCDLYESTFLSLKYLYPKVSKGGFVIIDDYNAFKFCKKAVLDFRSANNIETEIIEIDKESVYWRK
jgi:O-methyltransferase